ncbi:hypothetical protein [Caldivirga maquilingensis]|uniref:hypothetical protein n=1 Tax=Caldivirga maquilingensis TaxID=76887 RepID=UPI000A78D6BC|nr:hypothetical protein [Caldivirga maquilingensis]
MNAHGKYWYSHVYRQVMIKRPFGRVFILDKVDLLFRNRVFSQTTSVKRLLHPRTSTS